MRWQISFRWQLANNIARRIIFFPLEEGSLEVNVTNVPTRICSMLANKTKTRTRSSWRVSLLVKSLFILKTSKNPASFAFLKITISVSFDGQNPATSHKITAVNLAQVNKIKNFVVFPALILIKFGLSKLLGIHAVAFASFRALSWFLVSFGFEPEVTAKIAKIKGVRIYEVGISYFGRTFEEGKKIGWKDGFRAIYCILKYH
jgi:hypothetical protein